MSENWNSFYSTIFDLGCGITCAAYAGKPIYNIILKVNTFKRVFRDSFPSVHFLFLRRGALVHFTTLSYGKSTKLTNNQQ